MALIGDGGLIVLGAEVHDFFSTVVAKGGIEEEGSIDALIGRNVDKCWVVGCVEERGEGW